MITEFPGEVFGRQSRAQAEYPLCALLLAGSQIQAIDQEECPHRRQGGALVAIDEMLSLGYAMRQNGGLHRDVRALVVGVSCRPPQGGFEPMWVAELILSLSMTASEDLRVQVNDIADLQVEVMALIPRPRGQLSAVVIRQDLKSLGVLLDNAAPGSPYQLLEPPGRYESQLTIAELLDRNLAPGLVAQLFQVLGKRDNIAVTHSSDLDNVHGDQYIPGYTREAICPDIMRATHCLV